VVSIPLFSVVQIPLSITVIFISIILLVWTIDAAVDNKTKWELHKKSIEDKAASYIKTYLKDNDK